MANNPVLVQVGAINGGTPITADISAGLYPNDPLPTVTLMTAYTMLFPLGFPIRPGWVGTEVSKRINPIPGGSAFKFLKPETDALVSAGAASYEANRIPVGIAAGILIYVDITDGLDADDTIELTLTTSYELLFPYIWPSRPIGTGAQNPIAPGTTASFLKLEADALVSAGVATYA